MNSTYELWGQIGATFYLTPEEAEGFRALSDTTETLFANLVKERRYEVNDQFYAPDFDETYPNSIHLDSDIFIHLNEAGRRDESYTGAGADTQQKIWCRMGIVLYIDSSQLECLQRQDSEAANLVFDLISANRYIVEGSSLFESGIVEDGYICPDDDFYIDYLDADIAMRPVGESQQKAEAPAEPAQPFRVAMYARVGNYKQLCNPMLELADRISELTDGGCKVGPGPFGFGVANQHQSKIGIVLKSEPGMVKDDTIFPPDVKGYDISVQGFHCAGEQRLATPEEIETAALDAGDPDTQKIAFALRELSEPLWISTENCNQAFNIMAKWEMEQTETHPQKQGPTMTM